MAISRKKFQDRKNKEAVTALTKVLESLTENKATTKRFNLWATGSGVGISMEISYEQTQETPKENPR